MYLKLSSEKWRPFCLGLNVLTYQVKIGHRVQTEIMNDKNIHIYCGVSLQIIAAEGSTNVSVN